MKTTWKGLLAGTAALAIAACTPPADEGAEGGETAEATDEGAASEEAVTAEDGETAETPEAGAEAAAETEEDERDPHGNPAGPLRSDAEQ
ncbi:MAG: hypothetical protein ACX930_10300 [Erythrobacter sp.]